MEQPVSPNAEERILSALGYAGILFLIPLFLKKDSLFCQFHGKQGFILFIVWILDFMLMVIPFVGWIVGFFGSITLSVLSILAIIEAIRGEQWELPWLAEYAKKLKL